MFGNMNNTMKDNKLTLKNSEKLFQRPNWKINSLIHAIKNPELKIEGLLIMFYKSKTIQGHH